MCQSIALQLIVGITTLLSEHQVRNFMVHRHVQPVTVLTDPVDGLPHAAKKRVIISRSVQAIPILWQVYIFHCTV